MVLHFPVSSSLTLLIVVVQLTCYQFSSCFTLGPTGSPVYFRIFCFVFLSPEPLTRPLLPDQGRCTSLALLCSRLGLRNNGNVSTFHSVLRFKPRSSSFWKITWEHFDGVLKQRKIVAFPLLEKTSHSPSTNKAICYPKPCRHVSVHAKRSATSKGVQT